jgi:hypothetical protein
MSKQARSKCLYPPAKSPHPKPDVRRNSTDGYWTRCVGERTIVERRALEWAIESWRDRHGLTNESTRGVVQGETVLRTGCQGMGALQTICK